MSEYQLFILWERSRYHQKKILTDIREYFSIVKQYEISWTAELVSSNFTRFYGENLPNHSVKEQECGVGPFLLIIVEDPNPKYAYRQTTHGVEWVNTNMFDAKTRYRSWTGGGHKIHCSNTQEEFNHDITLLLGKNTKDFEQICNKKNSEEIDSIQRDVVGSTGWNSIDELMYVMNATIRYVVMRGEEWIISSQNDSEHRDIDLLLTKRQSAVYILNGSFYCNPIRPHILVKIAKKEYIFDLWECGHGAFDAYWEYEMLKNRELRDMYYTLSQKDYFYNLLYHCLVNKNKISNNYLNKLTFYKQQFAIQLNDWCQILVDYLSLKSYVIPLHNEVGVEVNIDNPILHAYAFRFGILRKRLCEEVEGRIYLSSVYEKPDGFVKMGTEKLIENETRFLKKLSSYSYFPKLLLEGCEAHEKWIEISRVQGIDIEQFFIKNHKNNTISNVSFFLREWLKVLMILRKENIIHRDMMPANMLIDARNGSIKRVGLIDFGWSIYESEMQNCVTPPMLGGEYANQDKSSDIYSFIVLLKKYWPRIGAVSDLIHQLQKGVAFDRVTINFSVRDYFEMYLLRHKWIANRVYPIMRKIRKLLRIIESYE